MPAPESIEQSWPATVSALPVGSHVSGRVVGRQPFGVFLLIDGVPNGLGLAEITAMPLKMELPVVGTTVAGVVLWHAERNFQVKTKLDEWDLPG
jgi:ribosomal protein S1